MIADALALLSGWRGYAAAALAGGVAMAGVQQLRVDAVQARLAAAELRVSMADTVNRQCAADVSDARAAVSRLRAEADAREALAKAAVVAAETAAARHESAAGYWRRRVAQRPDQCAAAEDALDEYLKGAP
ncbi:Uncharacterised protein [Bordetella ansorpii]|uniref:Uncharacterized protein n=1 Tax=Bordetella ansorpii TaxID=288768 RepID=A0A157SJF0_9BORD|nr:hypothetical protein [Bordetella ansorpii]SAI70454.1 Uncharacterised protein [Bordetella ansorpii]